MRPPIRDPRDESRVPLIEDPLQAGLPPRFESHKIVMVVFLALVFGFVVFSILRTALAGLTISLAPVTCVLFR